MQSKGQEGGGGREMRMDYCQDARGIQECGQENSKGNFSWGESILKKWDVEKWRTQERRFRREMWEEVLMRHQRQGGLQR